MIDHIFMFIDADGPEIAQMERHGLVETYRRVHPGQGTRNVCYCFDNMFLELLWIDDPEAVRGPLIKRTGLYERSLWREKNTCPFGVAWRGSSIGRLPSVPTWAFTPPYLPEGMSIAVATDGDDFHQPMMFRSPGSTAPLQWPLERRGQLQHDQGLGAVVEMTLTLPFSCSPSEALQIIAADCHPGIRLEQGSAYGLNLRVEGLGGRPGVSISLPR